MHFMKGKINQKYKTKDNRTIVYSTNIGNLKINDYITFNLHTKYGGINIDNGQKYKIVELSHKNNGIIFEGEIKLRNISMI